MTEQDYIDLSKRVAEKLGVAPTKTYYKFLRQGHDRDTLWLHQDSARCFELANDHKLDILHHSYEPLVGAGFFLDEQYREVKERFTDHNNDRNLSARIAILKALEVL